MRVEICFFLLLAFQTQILHGQSDFEFIQGALTRGDKSKKEIALAFTGDEFADGAAHIIQALNRHSIQASFFFTGRFYRNPRFTRPIKQLIDDKHYLGAHSDKHLLYCDWSKRDSLLVTKQEFIKDLKDNYMEMKRFGIPKKDALYFLPPYEWYNHTIASWTLEAGLQLINHTHGTRSHADYTTPDMKSYISSQEIFESIIKYEKTEHDGLNGFILLVHIGTAPARIDKFYNYLDQLIIELSKKGYSFVRIDQLLNPDQ